MPIRRIEQLKRETPQNYISKLPTSVLKNVTLCIDGFWFIKKYMQPDVHDRLIFDLDYHTVLSRLLTLCKANNTEIIWIWDGLKFDKPVLTSGNSYEEGIKAYSNGDLVAFNRCWRSLLDYEAYVRPITHILEEAGCMVCRAPYSATAQAAYFSQINACKYVFGKSDLILFDGTEKVILDLFKEDKIEILNKNHLLDITNLDKSHLLTLAFCLGCEYCPTIPAYAYDFSCDKIKELIVNFEAIEMILKHAQHSRREGLSTLGMVDGKRLEEAVESSCTKNLFENIESTNSSIKSLLGESKTINTKDAKDICDSEGTNAMGIGAVDKKFETISRRSLLKKPESTTHMDVDSPFSGSTDDSSVNGASSRAVETNIGILAANKVLSDESNKTDGGVLDEKLRTSAARSLLRKPESVSSSISKLLTNSVAVDASGSSDSSNAVDLDIKSSLRKKSILGTAYSADAQTEQNDILISAKNSDAGGCSDVDENFQYVYDDAKKKIVTKASQLDKSSNASKLPNKLDAYKAYLEKFYKAYILVKNHPVMKVGGNVEPYVAVDIPKNLDTLFGVPLSPKLYEALYKTKVSPKILNCIAFNEEADDTTHLCKLAFYLFDQCMKSRGSVMHNIKEAAKEICDVSSCEKHSVVDINGMLAASKNKKLELEGRTEDEPSMMELGPSKVTSSDSCTNYTPTHEPNDQLFDVAGEKKNIVTLEANNLESFEKLRRTLLVVLSMSSKNIYDDLTRIFSIKLNSFDKLSMNTQLLLSLSIRLGYLQKPFIPKILSLNRNKGIALPLTVSSGTLEYFMRVRKIAESMQEFISAYELILECNTGIDLVSGLILYNASYFECMWEDNDAVKKDNLVFLRDVVRWLESSELVSNEVIDEVKKSF